MSKIKKVIFEELDSRHASFRIRLRHDRIRQGEFFRFMLTKYIENDLNMLTMLEELKNSTARHGKRRRKKTLDDIIRGDELLKKLGLTDSEKKDIYDLLEKEQEDL